ncbi:MAG: methyltransferase domain-containing protein [Terriglobales bacterium]
MRILACPRCLAPLVCEVRERDAEGEVLAGDLICNRCAQRFPILRGIPRFVAAENYAASFGLQWNEFRLEQIDSANHTGLSAQRFYSETGWTPEWMAGKWLMDAGCGAGRFVEVASRSSAQVVAVDLSDAVDAARQTLAYPHLPKAGRCGTSRKNVHFVQASLFELPFRRESFDGCYCLGVLQHTPDPARAVKEIAKVVAPGGRLAFTVYERRPWTRWCGKYLVRPITTRVKRERLLRAIKLLMPLLFPVTEVLFRVPYLGRVFRFAIPVANYVDKPELSFRQRYRWAILDTFDALSPAHDLPQTQAELEAALAEASVGSVRRLPGPALTMVGEKRGAAAARVP